MLQRHMPDIVRQHAKEVAGESSHVKINDERLFALAESIAAKPLPTWDTNTHYFDGTRRSLMYTLILDASNFCFWPSLAKVTHEGKEYGEEDGYFALAIAVKSGFQSDTPYWEAEYLRDMSFVEFKRLFRGEMPLLAERYQNVQNLGAVLCEKYDSDPVKLLEAAGRHAPTLARTLADQFRAYEDSRMYKGRKVDFLKRAQLCASDIAGSFGREPLGALEAEDELTCFADYKLPQIFHNDGAFEYSKDLDARVRAHVRIDAGSEEEVEIRANTIVAVGRMSGYLEGKGVPLTERMIDWLLWNESVVPGRLTVPHHKTLTTSY